MKHIFIMNPAAGKGTKFHALIDEIHKVCNRRGVSYDVHVTEKRGEATEFVRESCASSEERMRFYAVGGDGTIREVASGIIGCPHAELGVIPMGTGNDFVRNFEHTEKLFDIDSQLDGETRKIDLLRYNGKYAVNLINIGFDCEIAKQAALNRRSIFMPSKLAYTAGVVQKITQLGTATLKGNIILDGKQYRGNEYQLCAIANGSYYGGGYCAAPAALYDDGIIDVCAVDKVNLGQLLNLIGHYKAGTHLTKIDVSNILAYKKCDRVEINLAHPTDISADGEIETIKDKLVVTVEKQAVTLSLPKACQPVAKDPEVMRAAAKYSKRV